MWPQISSSTGGNTARMLLASSAPCLQFAMPLLQFELMHGVRRHLIVLCRYVASGPLVRSSYKAGEFFIEAMVNSDRSVMHDHAVAAIL